MITKRSRIYLIIAGIITIVLISIGAWKLNYEYKSIFKSLNEDLPSTYQIPQDYSDLISEKYRQQLTINETHQNKLRNPVTLLYYNADFNLIIYKIASQKAESLKRIIKIENTISDRTSGIIYKIINHDLFFKLQYKAGEVESISKIYAAINADSLSLVYDSGSLICYHMLCKDLSIRYGIDAPIDLLVVGNDKLLGKIEIIPMDIAFLLRSNNLYFLMMTPRNSNSPIPDNLLLNIIK